ncbi:methyltransferase domain-containing protein [Rickettsia typhi]|uniref:Methyltransferase type 11 domain-containing protein n=2 Tax=Rickettsia typhi TaxID=785 RepID=Q68X37_RICTY|nr:hypothetical protein [Rickettsia typhi]AAU03805.1 rickettsial conserved hypothetical protein [Rickettsia typhi str. Wilmington]AFE54182.1 hypothetical protein RTTH1527_01585 [Rickettsia typhi str. TH1527]AFE55022.1 hypothetical protein RTB9991CWPP_01595 [Rickettsia typhi str. B9991CWPP]
MIVADKIVEEWYSKDILHIKIKEFISPVYSVIDIGCGIRPQQYIIPDLLICVEPYKEYTEILKKNLSGTNSIIIPLDAKSALSTLPDKSIDSIFLIDVIEHIPKEIGKEILIKCTRIARRQIIIFTPLGFMPQEVHEIDGWNLHGGVWQEHKSGWYPEDFPGWNIIGCKELHTHNSNGELLTTPYGGFYAIKNIVYTENYFNDLYGEKVLFNSTNHLENLKATFPDFKEKVINSEIVRSSLKCGLWMCQRTTELLIEKGTTTSLKEILEIVDSEKINFAINAAQEYVLKINNFASQFKDINKLYEQINNLQELFKSTIDQLTDQLIVNTEELERLKEYIKVKEQELKISNENCSIFIKIYAKIRRMLNKFRAI